jgi:ATP-dependent RNA helicase DHX29
MPGDVRTLLSYLIDRLAYLQVENDKFYKGKNRPDWNEELLTRDDEDDSDEVPKQDGAILEKRYAPSTISTLNLMDERVMPYDLIVRLLEELCFGDPEYLSYSSAILVFMPGLAEIRRLHDMLTEHPKFGSNDFMLYPLHSTLTSEIRLLYSTSLQLGYARLS